MNTRESPNQKGLDVSTVDELIANVEERVSDWHGRHLVEMSRALLKVSLPTEFDALSTQQQEQLGHEVRDLRRHPRVHTSAALVSFWRDVVRLDPPPPGKTWGGALAQELWVYGAPVLAAFEAGGFDVHVVGIRFEHALSSVPRSIDWEQEVSALVEEIQLNVQAILRNRKELADRERAEYLARIHSRIDQLMGT